MKDVKDFDAARLWPVINRMSPGRKLANTNAEPGTPGKSANRIQSCLVCRAFFLADCATSSAPRRRSPSASKSSKRPSSISQIPRWILAWTLSRSDSETPVSKPSTSTRSVRTSSAAANVNARRRDGLTALHSAAWRGLPRVIQLLLDHGAGHLDSRLRGGRAARRTNCAGRRFIAGPDGSSGPAGYSLLSRFVYSATAAS